MNSRTPKQNFLRWTIYLIGCFCLAFGLTIHTKTGLGISPILSIAFCISLITGTDFAILSGVLYIICTALQIPLKKKNFRFLDAMQFPFALAFSFMIGVIGRHLPFFETIPQKAMALTCSLILTGIGIFLMVNMKLIANPADGLVYSLGIYTGKGTGFVKNCVDFSVVALTCVVSLIFPPHKIQAVGIGTVCASVFVGRIIALLTRLCGKQLKELTGM